MSKGCPLKTAFVASKLDELQADWRTGADVSEETKKRIQAHAKEKYKGHLDELFEDPDDSISLKSIENAICRARKKMGIINPKGRRNSPVRGSSKIKMGREIEPPYVSQSVALVSNRLYDEIKRLIGEYSLEEVKKAISIIEGAIFQNLTEDLSEGKMVEPAEAVKWQEPEKAELGTPADGIEAVKNKNTAVEAERIEESLKACDGGNTANSPEITLAAWRAKQKAVSTSEQVEGGVQEQR